MKVDLMPKDPALSELNRRAAALVEEARRVFDAQHAGEVVVPVIARVTPLYIAAQAVTNQHADNEAAEWGETVMGLGMTLGAMTAEDAHYRGIDPSRAMAVLNRTMQLAFDDVLERLGAGRVRS